MAGKTMHMTPNLKYARIERERRFLVARFPHPPADRSGRRITDRYIEGTNLRLREEQEEGRPAIFKLSQKIPAPGEAARQGYITTMYLNRDTYERLAELAARALTKIRYSVPPFGVDVFEGALDGLVMAEAEFDSAAEAAALILPDFVSHEVSGDPHFSGGVLASASRRELEIWLAGYGVTLGDTGALGR
jgi:CYTH domain-containing protein